VARHLIGEDSTVEKEYLVRVEGELSDADMQREDEWNTLTLDDKFKEWMEFYKGQGYSDEELKQYYEQYTLAQMPEEQRRAYLDQKTKSQYYKKAAATPSSSPAQTKVPN
jgi:16S rRNA U516 pseudouridylate synthase RsuA-like enzyme